MEVEDNMTMKDMCKVIAKANMFERKMTAREVFDYSPTGELWRIFEWYQLALLILKKDKGI